MSDNLNSEKPSWVWTEKLPEPDDCTTYCPFFLEAYKGFEVFGDDGEIWVANQEQTWNCQIEWQCEDEILTMARELIDNFWESELIPEQVIIPGLEYTCAKSQEDVSKTPQIIPRNIRPKSTPEFDKLFQEAASKGLVLTRYVTGGYQIFHNNQLIHTEKVVGSFDKAKEVVKNFQTSQE